MSNPELAELSKKLRVFQKKGGVLILLTFQVLNKDKLRRSELSAALGARICKEKGGLLSDKTLDQRLKELTVKGSLESETDYLEYPPAKYYKLTEKGKKIGKTLHKLIPELY